MASGGHVSAIEPFLEDLRERLENGALIVSVDPMVHDEGPAPRWRFFVTSEWREAGALLRIPPVDRIDLFFVHADGRWYWGGMRTQVP